MCDTECIIWIVSLSAQMYIYITPIHNTIQWRVHTFIDTHKIYTTPIQLWFMWPVLVYTYVLDSNVLAGILVL